MRTYANPIAREGDFADPFVLRFNGRYYLYCTNPDLRCWSSADLLEWTLEGPTIEPGTFGDLVPFAPEVTYDNGVFHLYTSPSGTGHRILTSQHPTGPFVPVTGNLGHAIDGHVFVDDDGRRYFYWAGDEGIWGCEMASPTELGEPVLTGAFMHGWTEGPFVLKRDGRYHLTLTGNHYLSPGYRINAAVSDHPLHGYRDSPLNPILVSTAVDHLGLGHSSTVLGPDLVSTYLVYHNLNPDQTRDLNLDRQVWRGDLLEVLGPSRLAIAPAGPDEATSWGAAESQHWEVTDGVLLEQPELAQLHGPGRMTWRSGRLTDHFTSEHTISARASGYALTADRDQVGWRLEADSSSGQLRVLEIDHDRTRLLTATPLPVDYRHDVLHCYRLVGRQGQVEVFLDNRRVLAFRPEHLAGLHLGYHCGQGTLTIGHTALTRTTEHRASAAAPRPVPGRLLPNDAADPEAGDGQPCRISPGTDSRLPLFVPAAAPYDLCLAGDFAPGATVTVTVAEASLELEVARPTTALFGRLWLDAGPQTLVVAVRGRPVELRMIAVSRPPQPMGEAVCPQRCSGTGKVLTALPTAGEWEFTATVTVDFENPEAHADLLVCGSELAEGGEGDDTRLGLDFLLGYSVQFHPQRVVLARHAYDESEFARLDVPLEPGVPHRVVVARRGGEISAQIDDLDTLVARDPWPHPGGRLGLRTKDATITLEHVAPAVCPEPGEAPPPSRVPQPAAGRPGR